MNQETANALELRHVSRSFKDFTLQDISLELPQGCILGLIGENGAGKSTTIRLILNALHADCGEILVWGQDNTTPAFSELKESIGVVLDEAYFPEVLTVSQVQKVMRNTYRQWNDTLFQNYLYRFDLPLNRQFKDFSRGMKMKLAIAVALSHDPKLLILDEATSGLDPIVRDEILQLFADFTRDETHSILLSSHILSDLEKLCDYVAFLHKGKLLFCEEKDRLLEKFGIVTCAAQELQALPQFAVIGAQHTAYGVRALVRREAIPGTTPLDRANMEDIILFLAKEESNT